MQSRSKRGRVSATAWGYRAPRGYSRSQAQRRGRARARGRRPYRAGYDRTVGYYGRPTPERKFFDVAVDDAIVASTGTIWLNASAEASMLRIPEGNGESARIGRKITIKNINWRWLASLPTTTTAADSADVLRILLYHDKQTNGAPATVAEILEDANFQSFNNLANAKRFRILKDMTIDIVAPSGGTSAAGVDVFGDNFISGTMFKKCNIPIVYNNAATDGSLATLRSSNIGMLALSSAGKAGFLSHIRFRYTDM